MSTINNVPTQSKSVRRTRLLPKNRPITYATYDLSSRPEEENNIFVFRVGNRVVRRLQLVKFLGQGGTGIVYVMKDVTNEPHDCSQYAVKMVFGLPRERLSMCKTALDIIRFGTFENHLAELYDAYFFENDLKTERNMYMVMRYYENGDIRSYMRKMIEAGSLSIPQHVVTSIASNLFAALRYLHSRDPPVIHRDVSSDNLLIKGILEDGALDVVLNDFDTTRELNVTGPITENIGKVIYWAPEVTNGNYDISADIWSAGVLLFELMSLKRDVNVRDGIITNEKAKHAEYHEIMSASGVYDPSLIDMVLCMLRLNPQKRPPSDYLFHYFNKEWNEMLLIAARMRSEEFLQIAIKGGANDWNGAMHAASKAGSLAITKLMITKGANDWQEGLISACFGGNMDIVELMISNGANDWNRAIKVASERKFHNITQLLTSKLIIKPYDNSNGPQTEIRTFEENHSSNIPLSELKSSESCIGGKDMIYPSVENHMNPEIKTMDFTGNVAKQSQKRRASIQSVNVNNASRSVQPILMGYNRSSPTVYYTNTGIEEIVTEEIRKIIQRRLLDQKFVKKDSYDFKIHLPSIGGLENEDSCSIQIPEDAYSGADHFPGFSRSNSRIVSVVGHYSAGKTYLINLISGSVLPTAIHSNTVGISAKLPTPDMNFVLLDTAGFSAPVPGFVGSKELEKLLNDQKATEMLLHTTVATVADYYIYVTSHFSASQQIDIATLQDHKFKKIKDLKIFIIHNIKDAIISNINSPNRQKVIDYMRSIRVLDPESAYRLASEKTSVDEDEVLNLKNPFGFELLCGSTRHLFLINHETSIGSKWNNVQAQHLRMLLSSIIEQGGINPLSTIINALSTNLSRFATVSLRNPSDHTPKLGVSLKGATVNPQKIPLKFMIKNNDQEMPIEVPSHEIKIITRDILIESSYLNIGSRENLFGYCTTKQEGEVFYKIYHFDLPGVSPTELQMKYNQDDSVTLKWSRKEPPNKESMPDLPEPMFHNSEPREFKFKVEQGYQISGKCSIKNGVVSIPFFRRNVIELTFE